MRAAELARALGAKRSGRQFVCKCPAHDDSEPSLIFWDGETAIRFKCYSGCEPVDVINALRRKGIWQSRPADDRGERHRDLALALWHQGRDLLHTPAEYYLALRGLYVPPQFNGSLARFHPNCPRRDARAPALMVLFRSIRDDVPCAVQRIFLTDDYRKLDKPMMLGPVGAAAMKLGGRIVRPIKLTICEGFETALGLFDDGYDPCWALGSAGAIERFPIIKDVNELIVAIDNDPVGKHAADVVLERWGDRARGIVVE